MRVCLLASSAAMLASCASSVQSTSMPGSPAGSTAAYFETACARDDGKLWGVSLCGPLIVADPSTRLVWASEPDGEGVLSEQGQGWTGQLPARVPTANTSVTWQGKEWIMVIAPLPERDVDRQVLVMHEAWHRIQDEIGLPALPSDARHLEAEVGRTLLRLEMRALGEALRSAREGRDQAVSDALAFRAARIAVSQDAKDAEDALDRNEGLASYTGVILGAEDDAVRYAVETLGAHDRHEALSRAYAYATGPAYGLLLDAYAPGWRTKLGDASPAEFLLANLRGVEQAQSLETRGERYGAGPIRMQERERAERRSVELQALRLRYTSAPRLVLPLREMQFEFDPNTVVPLDGLGSVYRGLTLRDRWGELKAPGGALITEDFTRIIAVAPDRSGLAGADWSLSLAEGYAVQLSPASGDFELAE